MNKASSFALATLLLLLLAGIHAAEVPATAPQSPMQVWADYDPNQGDFKEEIVKEETKEGFYYRESYISAYVVERKSGSTVSIRSRQGHKCPRAVNVHGWMGKPSIDKEYVADGWAEMTHDYCGNNRDRPQYTKYPEKLAIAIWMQIRWSHHTETPDHKSITDPKQTSLYVWYAMSRRVLSYLEQQKEVDKTRLGAKGYSYGGTLMWQLATDPRVKAIVAYFGIGWLEYYRNKQVWMYNNPYVEPAKTPGEEIFLARLPRKPTFPTFPPPRSS